MKNIKSKLLNNNAYNDTINQENNDLKVKTPYFTNILQRRLTKIKNNKQNIHDDNHNHSQQLIKPSKHKLNLNSSSMIDNKEKGLVYKRLSKVLYQTQSLLGIRTKKKKSETTRQAFIKDFSNVKRSSSLSSITSNSFHISSHDKATHSNDINYMSRRRIFYISISHAIKHSKKMYNISNYLLNLQSYIKHTSLQIKAITDQFKLISSNLQQFKVEYIPSTLFYRAYKAMSNDYKIKYNILLEETAALILQIQPLILKQIHSSIDQIIYSSIPSIKEEKRKIVVTEDDCFNKNIKWFINVTIYFTACHEVYEFSKIKATFISFTLKEYYTIKTFLDMLRFNSRALVINAKMIIEKYCHDEKMLNDYYKQIHFKEEVNSSRRRVASVRIEQSNMINKSMTRKIADKLIQIDITLDINKKKICSQRCLNNKSLLDLPVVNSLMQYYDKNTREKIIGQRMVNRYKEKEKYEKDYTEFNE